MNRRGFTLIELIVTVGIIGLLVAIGVPRLADAFRRQSVVSAREAVIAMHSAARANAVQRASRTLLEIRGNTLRIYSRNTLSGAFQQVGAATDLGNRYGVAVQSTSDTLWFDPRGLGIAATATRITVTKGEYRQSVVISPLGRVQQ